MDTHAIILFDRECVFCNRSVRFIIKRDKKVYFKFAALNGETGEKLKHKYNIPRDLNSMVLVENDRYFTGSAAVLRICRRLNRLYPLLYLFILVPRILRDAVYNLIAHNRHRLNRNSACPLPSKEERKRLLD